MSYRIVRALEFTGTDEQKRELKLRFDGYDSEMKEIFMFSTREGFRRLNLGDYVAINSDGEGWIISPQTMKEMYVEVDESLMKRAQQESEEAQMEELEQYGVAESEEEDYINEQENGGNTNA